MAYENNVHYVSSGWWDFDRQQAQKIDPWRAKRTELGWLSSVSFAPDSRRVAVSDESDVVIFDVAKRTPIAAYPHETNGGIIRFSADGHTIAVVNPDSSYSYAILLIDTDLYHRTSIRANLTAIQPDNKHLTILSFDGDVAIYSSIENRSLEPIITRSRASDQSSDTTDWSLSPNGLYYAFTDD